MVHKLGVEESISLELCVLLYKQYGTTMAGLRVSHFIVSAYASFLSLTGTNIALLLAILFVLLILGCWVPV